MLQYVTITNGDSKSIFPTSLPSGSQTWTYLDLRQVLRHPWLQKYFRAFLQQLQQHTARARAAGDGSRFWGNHGTHHSSVILRIFFFGKAMVFSSTLFSEIP